MLYKNTLQTICLSVMLGCLAALSTPASAANEAIMQLIEIMHKKGSITNDEYELLKGAALADNEQNESLVDKKDLEKTQKEVDSKLKSLSWAEKVKIKGDMRLRYQYQDGLGQTDPSNRDRGRVRYRLGIIATPTDKMEVGGGLTSGSDDPRSTNQTFENAFSTKGLGLDYAYINYKFTDQFSAVGGKFGQKGYLWKGTDMMWDDDINPEGFSGNFTFTDGLGKAFVNGGVWVIDESGSNSNDPYMGYAQLGQTFGSGDVFGTLVGSYFGFAEFDPIKSGTFPNITPNPSGAVGNTDNKFDVVGISGELGKKNLFGNGIHGSIMGDYVNNTATSTSDDTGFAIGAKVTNDTWTLKYIYADLDANAVPDFLPDSDRYDGHTNMKGHEGILEYNIFKYTTLGLDFYHTWDKTTKIDQNILQADVVVKF